MFYNTLITKNIQEWKISKISHPCNYLIISDLRFFTGRKSRNTLVIRILL